MVLWSAIERIAALKYNIGKRDGEVEKHIESCIAADKGIAATLQAVCPIIIQLFSVRRPKD